MNPLIHRLTLDVTAESEEVMEREFCKYLRERGWYVAPPNENWEALGEFIKRVGLSGHDAFYRRLDEWEQRGQVIPIRRDKRKYIRDILSNVAFDAYCKTT